MLLTLGKRLPPPPPSAGSSAPITRYPHTPCLYHSAYVALSLPAHSLFPLVDSELHNGASMVGISLFSIGPCRLWELKLLSKVEKAMLWLADRLRRQSGFLEASNRNRSEAAGNTGMRKMRRDSDHSASCPGPGDARKEEGREPRDQTRLQEETSKKTRSWVKILTCDKISGFFVCCFFKWANPRIWSKDQNFIPWEGVPHKREMLKLCVGYKKASPNPHPLPAKPQVQRADQVMDEVSPCANVEWK